MRKIFLNWQASYELMMIRYLERYYNVECFLVPKKFKKIYKRIKFSKFITKILSNLFIKNVLSSPNVDDVVICNECAITNTIMEGVLTNLKCKKILLIRNPISLESLDKIRNLFDHIYTFEEGRMEELRVGFLPQFIPVGFYDINNYSSSLLSENVCYFLGKNKNRLKEINNVFFILKEMNCSCNFLIVKDKGDVDDSNFYIDKQITYEENLANVMNCTIILDIVQNGQVGWTLRTLEALYLNKKIITNNLSLLRSDIYSSNRFFIIGYDEWSDLNAFLNSSVNPVDADILYKYSPDNMLGNVLNFLDT